jgi:xylulokinase
MTRVVGLDVGTSSVKGLAIDEDGAVVGVAERGYPLSTPRPGWSEQDPEDWWRAAAEVLDELDAASAAGIGLSGQMHGLVALDSGDRPLRPAILWNDGRTQAQCDEIEERIGFDRLVELTGNRALAGFTAPKILWMAENEPALYDRIAHILLPKDYVRLKLTDEHAIDVADASGTLLFDVAARAWSGEVVRALEIDRSWLPEVFESPAVSGVTHGGVPVAAGAGDQAAGALGVGVVAEGGPASVVLGTSGVVFAALDRYEHDRRARVHAFCHAVPDAWHAMGVMLSAAGSASWLRSVLGGEPARLDGEAEQWAPGVEGLLFAPYLAGERTPHPDPDARGAFTGLSARHDRGALWRAMLEGVAFGLRDSLELLRELGCEPEVGRASGGGARSELWLRIVASALQLPIELTESEEGSAFGAALLAGVREGVFADAEDAVARCVRVRRRIEPEWDYSDEYERFRLLYPTLKELQ